MTGTSVLLSCSAWISLAAGSKSASSQTVFVPLNVWKCETLLSAIGVVPRAGSVHLGRRGRAPTPLHRSLETRLDPCPLTLSTVGAGGGKDMGWKGKMSGFSVRLDPLGKPIFSGKSVTYEQKGLPSLHFPVFNVCYYTSPTPKRLHFHHHACVKFRASYQKEWITVFCCLSEKAKTATKSCLTECSWICFVLVLLLALFEYVEKMHVFVHLTLQALFRSMWQQTTNDTFY